MTGTSRLNGAHAGRDLRSYLDVLVDLVDHDDAAGEPARTEKVARTVAVRIPKGTRIEVRADGRVYPAEEAQP